MMPHSLALASLLMAILVVIALVTFAVRHRQGARHDQHWTWIATSTAAIVLIGLLALVALSSCSERHQNKKAFDAIGRAQSELRLEQYGKVLTSDDAGSVGFSQQRPYRTIGVLATGGDACVVAHHIASQLQTLDYSPNAVSCQRGQVTVGSQRVVDSNLVSLTIRVWEPGSKVRLGDENKPVPPGRLIVTVQIAAGG